MQINIHQARLDEIWKNSAQNSKRNWDVDKEKGFLSIFENRKW